MRPAPAPPTFARPAVGLTDVDGLRASGVAAGIKASGRPDVALLVGDDVMSVGAVFTQNRLAAAPVLVSREHLAATGGRARAVVVSSGNANACTGADGLADARAMCARVAALVGCRPEEVLVCSTGVIGVRLPIERVLAGVDAAHAALGATPEHHDAFVAAIQTTDAFAKEEGRRLACGAVVAGACKGAGMIQPDMATLLAFVATDAAVELSPARVRALADESFNAVHVDSHPSTNDTFFVFSTGRRAAGADLDAALSAVSRRLAWLIARDGEGATKVTTIRVTGAASREAARAIANKVACSALVRTALYGNDPNWGRFTSQVANAREAGDVSRLGCSIQGVTVFRDGGPVAYDRAAVSRAMAAEDVELTLSLADGDGEFSLMTSDLGYRYVEINAEYTS
ncbi:MAG: bifunctional glutamate N-acetyltransferase/amino-acid acetyltransferase ArgJ [Polyangiaceae bacterium]|nr:bifunctional glutamate N-acetyltransferase/amino-acid acetyltransferase ArgJ [Polyangiaceae bacterium]